MHALVTGALGFVGLNLVPALESAGFRVSGVDRELEIADPAAVDGLVQRLRPDVIVHLAAQSSVAVSGAAPVETFRTNFLGTRSVLEAANRLDAPVRVLVVGSADEYASASPGDPPFRESSPLRPRSPYARSKAAADLLAAGYARRGLDVVRVRAFNHTGPGQTDVFVLPAFARQVAEISCGLREPEMRVGNLDSIRDFLDVSDVVAAYLKLLDPSTPSGVYNVASGTGTPLRQHLDVLFDLAGVSPVVEIDPKLHRPTDLSVGDSGKLRDATGWAPRVPFDDTLRRMLESWRERVSAA